MQVEEGRKGPALCAPSLSKTSHPQATELFLLIIFSQYGMVPLVNCRGVPNYLYPHIVSLYPDFNE